MYGDWRRRLIQSDCDFLSQGIRENQYEIWLYDRLTASLTRVTTSSDPATRDSWYPWLSADGRWLVLRSDSDFLGQGIVDGQDEVWLYDRLTANLFRITEASAADRRSYGSGITGDGRWLTLGSDSDFLSQGIADDQNEVWLAHTLPDLRVSKTVDQDNPVPGERLTYTVAVSNDGPADVTGAVVSDTLDGRLTFVPPIVIDPPGAGVAGVPPLLAKLTISAGQQVKVTFPVTVGAGVAPASVIPNTVAVSSTAQNVSATTTMSITTAQPVLEVTKTVDESRPVPGQGVTYTIMVRNEGRLDATGAVVSDTLDERLTFVGPATLDPPGAGTTGDPPSLATDLTINAGGRITLTFPVMVTTTNVTSGTVIANTAEVTSTEVDTPAMGSVSVAIGPAGVYLPVVLRSGS